MSASTSRLFRRAVIIGAAALALLWAFVVVHLLHEQAETVTVGIALAGIGLTAALALALRRYHLRLEGLAVTDPLTGLANHRGFHETLDGALADAARADRQVSVVLADLDDFKAVNDTHGHPHGDRVLIAVAERLQGCVRSEDIVARIGGEEFAMVVRGGTGRAEDMANRVRAAVSHAPILGTKMTCSAGIAVYPDDATDGPALCALADGAMYSAKRAGKDRVRRFDPDHVRHDWTERQEDEIERIVDSPGSVRAVFQPVVSLAGGRLVGYEALARFPGVHGRPVAALFAQAHGCGLGPQLEAVAVRAALEPLGRPPGAHVAINVSPSALTSPQVEDALPEDMTDLVIELTEHEIFPDDETLASALRSLRDRGARIAIDDTGAGYAGLKQLMAVRPDIVNLDRDLTRAIHADPARMALVDSFVRFARRIGATVCAEGIETLEDLAALADLDVAWGQGYALGVPSPPWIPVDSAAAAACRAGLASALQGGSGHGTSELVAGDRRLEHLSARLASARSRADLEDTLALVAAVIHAERVSLSVWHPAEGTVETLAENLEETGEPFFFAADYPLTLKVLESGGAAQVMVGDPAAEPSEVELLLKYGLHSLLMVPVLRRGECLGLIEAYGPEQRPWTRSEINRARIIANQFASVIEIVSREGRLEGAG